MLIEHHMANESGEMVETWMRRAIHLAKRGLGRVSPNPMVGAIVVRDGRIVGEGYHLFERVHHAERIALDRAGSEAVGADLFVTLEPCAHQGRTPPCVQRVIRSGVRRVFVATLDPNPQVAGAGLQALRRAGIQVEEGILEEPAQRLNETFFHFMSRGTPYVLLKLGLSLDGKIATRSGESKWITGPRARQQVQKLRYAYDAVLVGIETILMDNPSLDVRWVRRNSICKVVLDRLLRTPRDARLFESGDPVVLFHSEAAPPPRCLSLASRAILAAVPEEDGFLRWSDILAFLGKMGITSLLVEGGSRVASSAVQAGIVSRINFFYGPSILGGREVLGIGGRGVDRLEDAVRLKNVRFKRLDTDLLVEAEVIRSGPALEG